MLDWASDGRSLEMEEGCLGDVLNVGRSEGRGRGSR